MTDFTFWAPKLLWTVTATMKLKEAFLGRKAMTNLHSILKSRDITLLTKVCIVNATIFPVVMYRCECWTIKKAECQRIDAFKLWCWRTLLRVPWTARSNQSMLKEMNPECSLEGLMLKLRLQYLMSHLMSWLIGKDPVLGKIEGERRRGRQRMRWLDSIIDSMDVSLSRLRGIVKDRRAWLAAVHGVSKNQIQLSNWKTTNPGWPPSQGPSLNYVCKDSFCK